MVYLHSTLRFPLSCIGVVSFGTLVGSDRVGFNRLTYQHHNSTSLRKKQIDLLNSINYMSTSIYRNDNEEKWNSKYIRMKKLYEENGDLKIPVEEHDLANWLCRQKNYMASGSLDSHRKEKLLMIGVTASTCRSGGRVKKSVSSTHREKWFYHYNKLVEYKRIHGNCNVPRNWEQDPPLSRWVHNQRKQYKETRAGISTMEEERIEKLEEIGFLWTIRKSSFYQRTKLN